MQMAHHKWTDHSPDQNQQAKLPSKPMATGGHTKWHLQSQLAHTTPGLDGISGTVGTELCSHLVWLAAAEVDTWTHTQGWGMKQLSDDKGELNAEGGKKWPATNQVWLGRCVSPQQTQSPAGGWQRDAEVVKQIAARQAARAHHEMDRWDWEPLTLTTQRGGSVLENTQISQTHNRKINISVGYDFAC